MRTISIRLDDHTDAVLTAYCERHGLTQTTALKTAIEYLANAQRPSPAALAAEHGLIGAFRSVEGDLGENHAQHLKQRLRNRHQQAADDAPAATPRATKPTTPPTTPTRKRASAR
ncbi:hypothetical protein [Aquabacterium sp.]|uniref:hypothetical protein n=1 Tax=Aquabacterium sp. TaxID=1872578 RepID=UPI002C2997A6|nr:hypothetical protein [Aquabacterium sp.]HSW06441.1 hypothetical protein [Aquabacterium sp.]